MFQLQPVTALTISAAAVFGVVLALLGSLKFALAKRLDIGEGRIGGLLFALNLSLLPMMVLSGLLIDVLGVRWVLIAGSVLTAAAIGGLAYRRTYGWVRAGVLLAGCGSAAVSTAAVVLMPRAFFGEGHLASSLNLGFVFIALGALVTPVLTDLLLRVTTFGRLTLLLAGVCLVPAFLALFVPSDALKVSAESAHIGLLWPEVTLWLAAGVFFLYAPLEATVSVWGTTYLRELDHGERHSTWVLAGFWALFLGSRLLAAVAGQAGYLSEWWTPVLLVLLPLAAAAVLGNLAGTENAAGARTCLYLLGFVLGPIFPALLAWLFLRLEKDHVYAYGTAYGVVFAAGSLGSLLMAPVVALFAGRRSVRIAFRIPLLLAILLTLAALVLVLM